MAWENRGEKEGPKNYVKKLRDIEIARQYKDKVEELIGDRIDNAGEIVEEDTDWNDIVAVSIATAKEVCGEQEKRVENPRMIGKDDRMQKLKSRISGAVNRRNM